MPPRQRALPTDFDSRLARLVAADGRQALGGMSRVGSGRGKGRGNQGVLVNVPDRAAADSSAHLLAMSVTGASIASGGDHVPFDSIVAQHGFATVVLPGDGWLHPVSGVYLLTYEHAWDTYEGGGTVALEIDSVLIPDGTIMAGGAGQEGRATIAYVADAGQVGRIKVTHASGSTETCSAVVRVAITDPKPAATGLLPFDGNAVSVSVQGSPSVTEWVGDPAGWTDPVAEWIWHTTGVRPVETVWFEAALDLSAGASVDLEVSADDTFDLWVNGTPVLSSIAGYASRSTATVTLTAGRNTFQATASNVVAGSPAGFLLSGRHATTDEVVVRTSDDGRWYVYLAEPDGWPS